MRACSILLAFIILSVSSLPATAAQETPHIIHLSEVGDISEALDPDVDALLVESRDTLVAEREALLELARHKVVLYAGPVDDLTTGLDLASARTHTETTRYTVSGLTIRNGVRLLGGRLVAKDQASGDPEQGAQDYTRLLLQTADRFGSRPADPSLLTYRYRLPLLVNAFLGPYMQRRDVVVNFIDNCPFGQYNDIAIGSLAAEDDEKYAYWGVEFQQQMLSGMEECDSGYLSSRTVNEVRTNASTLYEYGPTTTIGDDQALVDVSFNAGQKGASISLSLKWPFPTPDIEIWDRSNFSENKAAWEMRFSGDASRFSFVTRPGISALATKPYSLLIFKPLNLYWKKLGEVPFHDTIWIEFR